MTNDVAVFIPWRDSGVLERQRSMSYVKNYLKTNLNMQVNFADGQGERFSLSAARNNAVSQARAMGAEVAIICDADTILEINSIIDAILHVKCFNSIVIPYKISRYLTEKSSKAVLRKNRNPNDLEAISSFDWSVGGAIVTSVDEWERVGGQDERFTGWGCEDMAFMVAAEKMGNGPIKIDGVMNHLWHPSAEKSGEAYEYNAMLLQRYIDTDNVELLIEEGKKGIR